MKKISIFISLFTVFLISFGNVSADEKISSQELVRKAWELSSKKDSEGLDAVVKQCVDLYKEEALKSQETLTSFPDRSNAENYQSLNDVGTCLFIQAEYYMNTGQTEKSLEAFDYIIREFRWAQAWDPRGWYWSIVEKSQASIDIITGNVEEEEEEPKETIRTFPELFSKAKEPIVDYSKYGEFLGVGTSNYRYQIQDIEGLQEAVGEGIYPNTSATFNNPQYKKVKSEGRLEGSHWDFVNSDDLEAAYFKWFTAPEPWCAFVLYRYDI